MSAKDRYVHERFEAPSTDPITANELAWIHLLRSVLGDADPPPTLAGVLALGITLVEARREGVTGNAQKNRGLLKANECDFNVR